MNENSVALFKKNVLESVKNDMKNYHLSSGGSKQAAKFSISRRVAYAVSEKSNESVFEFCRLLHDERIFGVVERSVFEQKLHVIEDFIKSVAGIFIVFFGRVSTGAVDLGKNIAEAHGVGDDVVIIGNIVGIHRITREVSTS